MYPRILEALIAVGLLVGAWLYAGHRAVSQYKLEQEVVQAQANKVAQEKFDVLAADYETLKTKRESDAKVIVRQVEKVIAGDVVYRNVCFSDSGLQLANFAISGTSPSKPADTVQATEQP